MILNIFDDMKSGVFVFDSFISIFVSLFTLALAAFVVLYLRKYIPKIANYRNELKTAERVLTLPDTLTVEGEIVEIHEHKHTQWDIEYTATVVYYVGQITFYSEYTFLNRGSLKVGRTIDVLCDESNPDYSAAADGSQITALKKVISIRVSGMILGLCLCLSLYMSLIGCLAGRMTLIDD